MSIFCYIIIKVRNIFGSGSSHLAKQRGESIEKIQKQT